MTVTLSLCTCMLGRRPSKPPGCLWEACCPTNANCATAPALACYSPGPHVWWRSRSGAQFCRSSTVTPAKRSARPQVPKVTFLDLYVYPTSTLEVQQRGGSTHIVAVDTSIDGSHHVKSLNCNDRFALGLDVDLRSVDDMCATTSSRVPVGRRCRMSGLHATAASPAPTCAGTLANGAIRTSSPSL